MSRPDEITRQYHENQLILDRRALMAPFLQTPFSPRDNGSTLPLFNNSLETTDNLGLRTFLFLLSGMINSYRYQNNNQQWLSVQAIKHIVGFLIPSVALFEFSDDRFERLGDALFRPKIATPASLIAYHGPGCLFQVSIADVIDAIVCGNFNKPKRWLEANVNLLVQRGTATAPNGLVIENVTPLQAAILSRDTETFALIHDMLLAHRDFALEFERQRLEIYARRLTAFCDQINHAANRLQALLDTGVSQDTQSGRSITPECIAILRARCDVYHHALGSRDFQNIFNTHQAAEQSVARDTLDPIFEAINNATATAVSTALSTVNASWQETDDARPKPWTALTLTEKINRFRNTLKTNVPNAEYLLQIAFLGQGHTHSFVWNNFVNQNKKDLCWRQVVGSIQFQLPVRTAHAFSYNFYEIVEKKHQFPRSLKLKLNGQPVHFYHARLGFDFATYNEADQRAPGWPIWGNFIFRFETYVKQKQKTFKTSGAKSLARKDVSQPECIVS